LHHAPVERGKSGGLMETFSSLRIRDYRYLWLGQVCHAFALWMEQVARPLLVLEITGSAAHLGGVVAMRTLPQLFFGVWAGVITDWFDRRKLLLIDKSLVLLLEITFASLLLSNNLQLWHIYVAMFLRGTLMAFDQPARQSLIPSIVPADRVTNAVALLSATQNTMRIAGAAAAGFSLAFLGIKGTFAMLPVIYVGAVVATYLLRVPPMAKRTEPRTAGNALRDLVEGGRYAFGEPAIRGILLLSLVYFTFGMSYMQVFAPLFAVDVLEIGEGGLGFMLSLSGVGALVAALVIANRQPRRLGVIMPTVVTIFGGLLIAFSLATYLPRPVGLVLPLILIMLVGSMQTTYFSLSNAMLLHSAPEHMRGRVISLLSLDRAMTTLGAAVAGFLAEGIGAQPAQAAFGVVVAIGAVLVFALNRPFRSVTMDHRPKTAPVSTADSPRPEAAPATPAPRSQRTREEAAPRRPRRSPSETP